ncbi:hypothetical protein GTQ34_06680 [Muricauda sp. JGD-17]|uniref:Outer membrane protein beta-barrel domain-containing protein n=1 Tax=Flagellimonas ochracea TaxID=2696472 RepID=A0A964TCE0_9FLAO|nr:hypothetical protein [Allomuricauda ochracea]NAY91596.1 hypothetical protein [Allomuricauda ochracea]
MKFEYKTIFPILCLVYVMNTAAQEETKKSNVVPFGIFGISYSLPISYGNNFVMEGYNLQGGLNLDGRVLFPSNWTIGGQLNYFKGNVENISAVGGISNSRILHLHITGGYSLKLVNYLRLHIAVGPGYVQYWHTQGTTRFKDDGFSLTSNLAISYNLNDSIGIYLKLDHQWDLLQVDTASELNGFFNDIKLILPSVGIALFTF